MAKSRKILAPKPKPVVTKRIKTVEVPVHYEKSRLFRVIHADGVTGGILPSGRALNLAFYSERVPFPQVEVFDVKLEDGNLIAPRTRTGKTGFFREIEVSATLDWDTAMSLLHWLQVVIPKLEAIKKRRGA